MERTSLEQTSILRWEDDGGQAIVQEHPADCSTPQVAFGDNQPMTFPAKAELE